MVECARVDLRLYPFDRGEPIALELEGQPVRAFSDEPVAVALYAAGVRVLSRSIKYHRPRGAFCFAGACNGCLMRVGGVPNLKSCRETARDGLQCQRQNALPSVEIDMLAAADWLFPRGMDHHTLGTSSRALNAVLRKVVRQVGGLGLLPDRDGHTSPYRAPHDLAVCVIGAGPAGLSAATAAASHGRQTLLLDTDVAPGGSLHAEPGGHARARALAERADSAGVERWHGALALGFYPDDHGGCLAVRRGTGLERIRARAYVVATGGHDQNALFPDNDRPGVLAARAAGRLLHRHGVRPGERLAILHDGGRAAPFATRLFESLAAAGVPASLVTPPRTIAKLRGLRELSGLELDDRTRVPCDTLAVAEAPAPASELARQMGAEVTLDAAGGGFRVVTTPDQRFGPRGFACGDVCGYRGPDAAAEDGERAGLAAAEAVP